MEHGWDIQAYYAQYKFQILHLEFVQLALPYKCWVGIELYFSFSLKLPVWPLPLSLSFFKISSRRTLCVCNNDFTKKKEPRSKKKYKEKTTKGDALSTPCLAKESAKAFTDRPTDLNSTCNLEAKKFITLRWNRNLLGADKGEETHQIAFDKSLSTIRTCCMVLGLSEGTQAES